MESSEIDLSEFQEEINGGGDGDNNVDSQPDVDAEPRNGATEPTFGNGGEILMIIFTVTFANFLWIKLIVWIGL